MTGRRLRVELGVGGSPLTSFVVVPIFALASAGVVFTSHALDGPSAGSITGIGAGLISGKILGKHRVHLDRHHAATRPAPPQLDLATDHRYRRRRRIGFAISLFIAGLAFPTGGLEAAAQIGILVAFLIAALVGTTILLLTGGPEQPPDNTPAHPAPI